jgi:hypothetical protein
MSSFYPLHRITPLFSCRAGDSPGVVIQGDNLHGILQRLANLRELAITHRDDEELAVGLANLHELLEGASRRYEAVCQERGIELPYPAG